MRGGGDVIFLATRPPPAAPLPRGSGPEDAAAARREARAAETTEARRDGGVGTHAVARALQACLPAASDRHVTASAARSSLPAASSRYEPGGDDAPGTWADALSVMADTLRDLGSLRTPTRSSRQGPGERRGSRRPPPQRARRAPSVFVGVNYAPRFGRRKHRRRASSSVRLRHRGDGAAGSRDAAPPVRQPDGARSWWTTGTRTASRRTPRAMAGSRGAAEDSLAPASRPNRSAAGG